MKWIEEKYKKWVLDYTDAWMERTKQNNGILPDNVGPTGKVGENRNGQWWGNIYGWSHYQGFNIMYHAMDIASECALLVSGDFGYLDLLRSQINVVLDQAKTGEDEQLMVPLKHGPDGWSDYVPLRLKELAVSLISAEEGGSVQVSDESGEYS